MDINQILTQLLASPRTPADPEWVRVMAREYPAFYFPAAMLVRRCHNSLDKSTLNRLCTYLAVHCPDRKGIADYADMADADWADIYPDAPMPQETSTDLTIETFINTYGHSTPDEDALLERLIFSPVPADYLAAPDEPFDPANPLALPPELSGEKAAAPAEAPAETAPAAVPPPFKGLGPVPPPFTGLRKEAAEPAPAAPAAPAADTSLMESLAQFFIKKGRYERAYDIISDLSLKFPEKSVYFAEQLRFLQKKMLSQKLSQENKNKKP